MAYRVGVDIGGSFTDFAVLDAADNTIRTLKVLSRPDQPGAEVIQGLGILGERDGIAPGEVEYFTHGTTVGVNTVIQRSGARLALFTTRNFEDVLELARLKMPNFHNLYARRPAPLVSRDRVFPVDERIDASGAVLQAIDEASLRQALQARARPAARASCWRFCMPTAIRPMRPPRAPCCRNGARDAGLRGQRNLAHHPRI